MKSAILTLVLLTIAAPAASQIVGKPIVLSGTCDARSGVSIDGEGGGEFACDTAIVLRSDRGTVLIQFTDKSGDDGRILGFGGTIEGKQGFGADLAQIVAVERVYLAGGAQPVPATAGTCIMNWTGLQRTGGRLTSIVCGGRGEAEGHDIKAMVALTVH